MNMNSTDELVYTDQQSGLMWSRNGNIIGQELTWENAINWAKHLKFGGYADWRLPTKEEFLAFRSCVVSPKDKGWIPPYKWFNDNGFNNVQPWRYWSSTVCDKGINAWDVSMYDFGYELSQKISRVRNDYAWPVRKIIYAE